MDRASDARHGMGGGMWFVTSARHCFAAELAIVAVAKHFGNNRCNLIGQLSNWERTIQYRCVPFSFCQIAELPSD
jgi:hypothetical protein